jgi:hypothetical protein
MGNFGWTGMPFAFQVLVRFLLVCVQSVIFGLVDMYVDDMIGIGHLDSWSHDREKAAQIFTFLLGNNAEETSKRESTIDNIQRSIIILGWEFNLSQWSVDIAPRNHTKALYIFWSFDLNKPIPKQRIEAICSLQRVGFPNVRLIRCPSKIF